MIKFERVDFMRFHNSILVLRLSLSTLMLLVLAAETLCVLSTGSQISAPGCIGEGGSQVDWFAILKAPNGAMYAYLDPTLGELDPDTAEWKISQDKTLEQSEGNALADTLQQVYSNSDGDIAYVQYNDEAPDEKRSSSYQGHTKGVWATGQGGGFWLVHSVPRFPDPISESSGHYEGYPDFAKKYGQSFLCISMDIQEMDAAALQFFFNRGMIYDYKEVDSLSSELPNFTTYVNGGHSKDPESNIVKLQTRSGKFMFTSFAKTHNWNDYLYLNLIAKQFETDLLVESWMNGINPDPSFCRSPDHDEYTHNILNVRHVAVADDLYGSVDWKETQDHSKWCVSPPMSYGKTGNVSLSSGGGGVKIACIGDINRQRSQNGRAGGTVCIEDEMLWTAFNKAIVEHDEC